MKISVISKFPMRISKYISEKGKVQNFNIWKLELLKGVKYNLE